MQTNSEHSEPTKQKPEKWELDELVIGDPEYSPVGVIAIFRKPGEHVEWKPLPPPEPNGVERMVISGKVKSGDFGALGRRDESCPRPNG